MTIVTLSTAPQARTWSRSRKAAERGGAGAQGGIDRFQLGGGGLDGIAEIGKRLDRPQGGHDAGAGEVARLVPAHAVGNRPKPDTGAEIGPLEKGILIALPHQPD